jgi:prepilin-type N-terminal cleavage/methylation domain-containing protein
MKKARLKKNEQGVTLMEVMIAMIILSVALLMLLNMAVVAIDGNDWSNRTTAATQMMQEKLEQLRNEVDGAESGSETIDGVTCEWDVTDGGDFLWQVDILVQWKDVRNKTHRDSITSFLKADAS